jgi:hypothetical protein
MHRHLERGMRVRFSMAVFAILGIATASAPTTVSERADARGIIAPQESQYISIVLKAWESIAEVPRNQVCRLRIRATCCVSS